MSYYYNDYDDDAYECEVCDRVFDNGPNWRANKNSMEMHLQVKLYVWNIKKRNYYYQHVWQKEIKHTIYNNFMAFVEVFY